MTNLVVQKFGGTSVQDIESLFNSAKIVKSEIDRGHSVVVVVSAAAGVTRSLIKQVESIIKPSDRCQLAEYDSVISAGEQINAGLFALTLISIGLKARSWSGWQLPIVTCGTHRSSLIDFIDTSSLLDCLEQGFVCVVAGFQGVCNNRITTLGRGGSDISAAAIAAALKAESCDIYTDVEGVFSADPGVVKHKVSHIPFISYDEMLELSSMGAGVLHPRSVEIAMNYDLKVRVLSSDDSVGKRQTLLTNRRIQNMERPLITGITATKGEVMVTIKSDEYEVFELLAYEKIVVNTIIHNYGNEKINFTIDSTDELAVMKLLKVYDCEMKSDISVLSIVGSGMLLNPGVASKMFNAILSHKIAILGITTSEIRISVLVKVGVSDAAVRYLHTAFGLDSC